MCNNIFRCIHRVIQNSTCCMIDLSGIGENIGENRKKIGYKRREGKGREGEGREGKGGEGKGREGKGRQGK